jgi:hypothetical protein
MDEEYRWDRYIQVIKLLVINYLYCILYTLI